MFVPPAGASMSGTRSSLERAIRRSIPGYAAGIAAQGLLTGASPAGIILAQKKGRDCATGSIVNFFTFRCSMDPVRVLDAVVVLMSARWVWISPK